MIWEENPTNFWKHPRDPKPHLQGMNFLSLLLNHTTSLEPPRWNVSVIRMAVTGCFFGGQWSCPNGWFIHTTLRYNRKKWGKNLERFVVWKKDMDPPFKKKWSRMGWNLTHLDFHQFSHPHLTKKYCRASWVSTSLGLLHFIELSGS